MPRHMSPISLFRRLFSCSLTTISIRFNRRWSFSRRFSSFPAPTPPGLLLLPLREDEDDPYGTFTAFRTILRCCCLRLDFDIVWFLPLVLVCANRVETRRTRSSSIAASEEPQPDMRLFGTCAFLVLLVLVCFFWSPDDSPTQKPGKSGNPGTPLLLLLLFVLPPPLPVTPSPSVTLYRPRCSVLGRAKLYHGASTAAGPMDRLSVAARASSSSTDDADADGRVGDGGGFRGRAGGATGPAGGEQGGQLSMFIATLLCAVGSCVRFGGRSPKRTYTCTYGRKSVEWVVDLA